MADHHLRHDALVHRALAAAPPGPAGAGVRLSLVPPAVQLCLRGDGGRRFAGAVADVLGITPPVEANTATMVRGRRILWLGPDEWLVVSSRRGDDGSLARGLERALDGQHTLVSDVSHSRAILALGGAHARDVLAKGCSLDLDPVAFAAGQCAQAPLARAHMLLHQADDAPTFHVYAHRSVADYVYAWLADAAAEYGLATGAPSPGD